MRGSRSIAVNANRWATLSLAICVAMVVASTVFLVLGPGRPVPSDVFGGAGGAGFLVLSLAFASVGWIVASRVPENRIGWVFCITGLLEGATVLAWVYADYGVFGASHRLPGSAAAAMFPGEPLAAVFGFTALLFPDGRLPSHRWRPAAYVLGLAAVLLLVSDELRPGALDDPFSTVTNPLGIPGTRAAMNAVNGGGWFLVVVGLGLAAASLLVRRRRARGVERQQLELVLAVGAVVAVVGGSGLAVAGSTLAAAALFRPARSRIQDAVDRRFYRRRYDAQRTVDVFSARLRNELDLAALSSDLRGVVRETLQPAHVSLWLRERP